MLIFICLSYHPSVQEEIIHNDRLQITLVFNNKYPEGDMKP